MMWVKIIYTYLTTYPEGLGQSNGKVVQGSRSDLIPRLCLVLIQAGRHRFRVRGQTRDSRHPNTELDHVIYDIDGLISYKQVKTPPLTIHRRLIYNNSHSTKDAATRQFQYSAPLTPCRNVSCPLIEKLSTLLLFPSFAGLGRRPYSIHKGTQHDRAQQAQQGSHELQEAGHGGARVEGDKLEELVHLVQVLLLSDDVARRCRGGGGGGGRAFPGTFSSSILLSLLLRLGRRRGGIRGRGVAGGDSRVARLGALLHGVPLLLGGVVRGRRRRGASAFGRGCWGQMQDADEADGCAVEGDEPDGEDLEDGEVEQVGVLIVDCRKKLRLVGHVYWRSGSIKFGRKESRHTT